MPEPTYCEPEPVQPAEAAAPNTIATVAPAEFPLPCEPESEPEE